MTASAATPELQSDEAGIPQYSLLMIIFMFAWPAALFTFLIYVIAPMLLSPDGTLPSWATPLIQLLGNGAELAVALIILRREGYRLTPRALRERINLRFPDKLWKWGAAAGSFLLAVVLVLLLLPLMTNMATVLPPPDFLPADLHPLKEVTVTQEESPDVNLVSNVLSFLFTFVLLDFVMNIIGEELYYRGALQPKMRGVFGRGDWIANGIGFTLKHVYFWWRFPVILPAGLSFAFIFGPMGSLPLSVFFHWLANII